MRHNVFYALLILTISFSVTVNAQETQELPVPVQTSNEQQNAVDTSAQNTVPPNVEGAAPAEHASPDNAIPMMQAATEPEKPEVVLSVNEDISVGEIPSLFFTRDALALLRDAIQGLNTSGQDVSNGSEKEPGIRELALGGIVFKGAKDWTIWLNGRRITPDTIPGEVFDLDVFKEYVDIKWYDAYTNRLFPVRLRANERFNLDSRLFLSGAHSEDQQL